MVFLMKIFKFIIKKKKKKKFYQKSCNSTWKFSTEHLSLNPYNYLNYKKNQKKKKKFIRERFCVFLKLDKLTF